MFDVVNKRRYLGFVEYCERIGTTTDGLDVRITGEWMLEPITDSLTGGPATAIRLDLENVVYGPSKNKADTWASLGPIKLMDIVYIDDDLQITRGNINPETLFVFQKIV